MKLKSCLDWQSTYVIGPVAQRLEQGTHNPLVPGSNPGGPSLRFGAQGEKQRLPRRNEVKAGFFFFFPDAPKTTAWQATK